MTGGNDRTTKKMRGEDETTEIQREGGGAGRMAFQGRDIHILERFWTHFEEENMENTVAFEKIEKIRLNSYFPGSKAPSPATALTEDYGKSQTHKMRISSLKFLPSPLPLR